LGELPSLFVGCTLAAPPQCSKVVTVGPAASAAALGAVPHDSSRTCALHAGMRRAALSASGKPHPAMMSPRPPSVGLVCQRGGGKGINKDRGLYNMAATGRRDHDLTLPRRRAPGLGPTTHRASKSYISSLAVVARRLRTASRYPGARAVWRVGTHENPGTAQTRAHWNMQALSSSDGRGSRRGAVESLRSSMTRKLQRRRGKPR
jgi:hypothetical protein